VRSSPSAAKSKPKVKLLTPGRSKLETEKRREKITADISARTGIDEAMVENLVRRFYAKVREDAVLGPIFDAKIHDWEPHLERMCAFWSSVALMTGRYHGSPMTKHMPLPIDAAHFDRWLALFEKTAGEICPPEAKLHFVERARRIAESLELGVAGRHGVLLRNGERFRHRSLTDDKKAKFDERRNRAE
jgi:hemoglobin